MESNCKVMLLCESNYWFLSLLQQLCLSVENNRMFESPPRAATNGPILMDDAMTPPPNQAQTPSHTPLSASRVTVATPGTVVQKTLVELDDLIHLRKMELSNLRAQNKVKYEVVILDKC